MAKEKSWLTQRMSKSQCAKFEKKMLKSQKHKRIIYNRFIVTFLLVLLQFAFWGFILFRVYDWSSKIILLLIDLFSLICVLFILNHTERPSSKLNWIIIILLFPFFGVLFYLLFGNGRPTAKMAKKIQKCKRENMEILHEFKTEGSLLKTRSTETGRYLQKYTGYPAYSSGSVEFFPSGEEFFPEMLKEMDKAKEFILVEYFIIASGKMWQAFKDMLLKKANEGVQIRMIFDDFGCLFTMPPNFELYMQGLHENIRCLSFNYVLPILSMRVNNRDHRKLLVIDGKVGFTGGINLADEYINEKLRFGYWKDTGIKISGNATNSLTTMFFHIWNAFYPKKEKLQEFLRFEQHPIEAGGEEKQFWVQPYDDSPLDGENVGVNVYMDMIQRAQNYVYVATPYLILDDFMRNALCLAAKRGVDVRILTPGIPDKKTVFRLTRANYSTLIKAGVKIYEYTGGFVHAKQMVCDDDSAVVGTINLDYRSLYLHFENAVYFMNTKAVLEVKKDMETSFQISKEITAPPKRYLIGRIFDSILRVFESLI